MRGASADSLAALTEALGEALDGGADPGRVAEDLFAVAEVMRRSGRLRRTATDASLLPDVKSELVRNIFGDRVDPAVTEILTAGVRRRWTATRDLADALEHLGVIALVRSAEQAGQADALEDELFGFERLLAENRELADALSDPVRSREDKRALVRSLLEGKVTPATLRLAEQAAVSEFHRTVLLAVQEYERIAAEHRHRLAATATVARELSERDRQRLEGALARQYGLPVQLNVVVDPDVLGGVKVEIGDDVIDGTVASRLDDARRRLAG